MEYCTTLFLTMHEPAGNERKTNMTAKTKILTMQTDYWSGVVADALWTAALVSPSLFGLLTGRPDLDPDLPFRLTMGIAASLMAGWTLLLVWASRSPVERRGVLLLTACPVIAGLTVVAVVGIVGGGASNLWILAKLAILAGLMLTGFHFGNQLAEESTAELRH